MTDLCPAPQGDRVCLRPLPCAAHDVPDLATGFGRYHRFFSVHDDPPAAVIVALDPQWTDLGTVTDTPAAFQRPGCPEPLLPPDRRS